MPLSTLLRQALLAALLAPAAAVAQGGPPSEPPIGALEVVKLFTEDVNEMPTVVTRSRGGRIFLAFPRWHPGVEATVAELVGDAYVAYPNAEIQVPDSAQAASRFVSVQAVLVGPDERLYVLDTGSPMMRTPPLAPKLVVVDLATNAVVQTVLFPPTVALETTYLNDLRVDLTRGAAGLVYITDSSNQPGTNGVIVADLATGASWRQLDGHSSVTAEPEFVPFVEARPLFSDPPTAPAAFITTGSDGITATPDRLFYRPLAGRHLYSVSLDALADSAFRAEDTVVDYGNLGFASDGIESDAQGRIYLTNYEDNAVVRFTPGAPIGRQLETLAFRPDFLWPDGIALGHDGYLYVTTNQLHRQPQYHDGADLRDPPYALWRLAVDGTPVVLGGTAGETGAAPAAPPLGLPAPNPARTAAALTVTPPGGGVVRVEAFDLLGRRVAVLHDGALAAGAPHALRADVAGWAPGVYVVRARGDGFEATQRLVVAR